MLQRIKHRFYFPQVNFQESTISVNESIEIHHIKHVLRLDAGDNIRIFNGKGEEAIASIETLAHRKMTLKIEKITRKYKHKPELILACAIPKKAKFETIIEKATELGVDSIIPLYTKRTEGKINADIMKRKLKRYEAVAINAAKQSWRTHIPAIEHITAFEPAIDILAPQTTMLILSLENDSTNFLTTLRLLKKPTTVTLLIGPEGDFTEDEYAYARKNGAKPVSLGETVLKVDTAALAALSCTSMHFHGK